ncbi:TPA: N-acetyltransferase [Pseudomonas aeruginosa]|uniref:N-acetyltransferase n=2 Tax=Pseudomonas aeruginosa group TaxID=136841 RepID=A0ABD7JYI1_PSEAI|nr:MULTISPECIES: N-acetyltransferase [Pseudomonas aeruginosa group]KFF34261.1 GCN5 family acetyltransferase [Pseudomonas aeruginosa VRFPA01]ABR85789.1 acetyltransferase, GNAT family [Pseudomonas aeruginosa PA7]KSC88756.1 GNAT family N-acetyltransferase [Pseudomonas aeruginosa]KSD19043.1 GNAT family N-acetyltransferase [Pseudomonas aeruginosa]KSG48337.1 GNAT family N-acetyltransferase [Pseudomonas aeruginosa]
MNISIRAETAADIDAIARLTEAAFRRATHASHTEQFIVAALRRAGSLTLSLVAEGNGQLFGHVAASPVTIDGAPGGWYGLAPVSVEPEWQGRGIGSRLIRQLLAELRSLGAEGCVVLGEPAYYSRFGFRAESGLVLPGVPAAFFQAQSFAGAAVRGTVAFHPAFDATG